MSVTTLIVRAGAVALLALAGACGNSASRAAQIAQTSEETSKDFDDYEVHINAIRTDQLPAEVARSYAIQRSKNQVLLNVTVLSKQAGTRRKAVEAKIAVAAHNLNGQVKDVELRRVNESDAIYYIGEVSISGNEILVFDVKVTPANDTRVLELKFKREFFTD